MTQHTGQTQDDAAEQARQHGSDLPIPRQAGPVDIPIPRQAGSSELSGPIPRPFAQGATAVDTLVAPPKAAPEKVTARPTTSTRMPAVGAVLAVVLLALGATVIVVARLASQDVATGLGVEGPMHQVTYQVTTEHGTPVTVGYSHSSGRDYDTGSVAGVASPWSIDTKIGGSFGPSVTASLAAGPDGESVTDTVTCTIVQDGAVVAHTVASGPDASASCFG